MTFRELYALFEARNLNAIRQHKLGLFTAWHTAAFYRQKRLSPLSDLLRKMEPSKVMSPRAMRAAIIGIAKAFSAAAKGGEKGRA